LLREVGRGMLLNYNSLYEKDAATRYYQRMGKELPKELERKSAYEKLIKYKNRSKIYFSFRSIEKIGINPLSKWNTPNGIYTYPLKEIIKYNFYGYKIKDGVIEVPFAGKNPYIYVIEAKGRGIKDISKYTEADLLSDIIKLKKGLRKYNDTRFVKFISNPDPVSSPLSQFTMEYALNNNVNSSTLKNEFLNEATDIVKAIDLLLKWSYKYDNLELYGYRLWSITRFISYIMVSSLNASITWNFILNKILKYDYIVDLGYRVIHNNEPYQAVFFNTSCFDVLEIIENKYPTEFVDENEYIRQDNIVWDYEFNKMTYSETLKYIESKRGNWRLPSMEELFKASILSVKGFIKTRKMKDDNVLYNYYFSNEVERIDNFEDYVYIYDVITDEETRIPVTSNEKHNVRLVRDVKVRQIKLPINDPKMVKAWVSDKTKNSNEMSNVQLIYKTVQGVPDLNKELIKKITEVYPKYRLPSLNNLRMAYEHIVQNNDLDLKDIFGNDTYWCVTNKYINVEDIKQPEVYIFNFSNGDYNTALLGDVGNIALIKK
jgi:hypothetical protein